MEVHRLDQVKIKSRFLAAANVFVRAKSSDRDCFHRLFSLRLGNHLITSSIRETNVAQDHVEFLRRHDFQRASRIIRDRNLVTKMSEQARQSMSRVFVVFHEEDASGFH